LEAKDVELVTVRAELEAERRKRTNTEQLRRDLREAQAEAKSLRQRIGVLRGDVDKAWQNEKRMFDAFEMQNAERQKSKDTGKRIQTHLVSEVERTNEENDRVKQGLESRNAKTSKVKQEWDVAVRRHRQAQEELGPLRMELSVAVEDLKRAQANQDAQQWDTDLLRGELGKKSFLAQANLKNIVEKFREQTNASI
jgi:chromosome segregation ATPase